MIKRLIALLLATVLMVSLCSCFDFGGSNEEDPNENSGGNNGSVVDPDAGLPGIGEGEGVEGPRIPWN